MKIIPDKRLFWFLKDGTELDINNSSSLDFYLQQVLTHGRTKDIKFLLNNLAPSSFLKSFQRSKYFLPKEVRMFWGDSLGNSKSTSKRNSK